MRTRTRYLSVIRAVLRREGLRVPSGSAAAFVRRLAHVELTPAQAAVVAPLVRLLAPLNAAIAAADAGAARRLTTDPVARRLATTPGVGPVTAVAFVATLDDVTRFARAGHQVARETDRSLSNHAARAQRRAGAQAAAWPAGRPDDTAGPSRVSTSAALGRRVRPVL